jgi:ribonuclease PH
MDSKKIIRNDKRTPDQLRPVSFSHGMYEFAAGSVLFEMGKTKVLCAVSLQNGVPPFLRGKGTGWLTAEYSLLPMSTMQRTQRESSQAAKNGRSVEIARFIGRCFRSIVDVSTIGERTITIDCDVLQADGGTRTAAISGAFLALKMAQEHWLKMRTIAHPIIKETIAAISVGVVNEDVLLDLNYEEDSAAAADFNFVITQSNKVVEMQGGAETDPLSWETFERVRAMAQHGAQQLFAVYNNTLHGAKNAQNVSYDTTKDKVIERTPMFSLRNRQQSSS